MYHGLARRYLRRRGFLMRPLLNGGTLAGLGDEAVLVLALRVRGAHAR